mgnify:CR=1 FL=1
MKPLTLDDLPSPPQNKVGWPWTEQSEILSDRMPDGSEWPRISIVTPSYNYGRFIEETIRSVLLQGYPNLEYIIIDGGSTDDTIEIIKKYQLWLTYWISEPDQGQTDAINKGFAICSGDIFTWLNADDSYNSSNTLRAIVKYYQEGYELIVGECSITDINGNKDFTKQQYGRSVPVNFKEYLEFWRTPSFPQPAVFVSKTISDSAFPLDTSLNFVMDFQFFLKVLHQNPKSIWINQEWVNFKYHGKNKTSNSTLNKFKGFNEIHYVALSESSKLPFFSRFIFRNKLNCYSKLFWLINSSNGLKLKNCIFSLIRNPGLFLWPLFWKVSAKSIVGENKYLSFKRVLKK